LKDIPDLRHQVIAWWCIEALNGMEVVSIHMLDEEMK
jgi:hypothetical protein